MKGLIQNIFVAIASFFGYDAKTDDMKPLQEGEYGIQETVDVFRAVKGLVRATKMSLEDDGKITIPGDLLNYISALSQLPLAAEGIKEVPKELKDLQESEKAQLYTEFGEIVDDMRYRRAFAATVELFDAINEIVTNDKTDEKPVYRDDPKTSK